MQTTMTPLIIGISGSSGVLYGIRLLEILQQQDAIETHLVLTLSARLTIPIETDYSVDDVLSLADMEHSPDDLTAAIASGSFVTGGMIVAPCSMKTLSGIVHSYADNLLIRAADVCLKEQRRLVVMPREAPLHVGHCKLLYEAAQMGVVIMPPMPAFYGRPRTIDDLVNNTLGRVLDMFGIDAGIVQRWEGTGR